ncbi:hypothetical protein NIES2119_30570 [[Phormidium ambiguum] IAM M-71]|uniref:Filamentous haemagglutinin FhaB/tRNA nuclease CdiA-like TPS domain-containing protein n=1 Tax=[Phormidium ambiguum] IAM M-71 TaxID=454136 RepID=A0A1U7I3F2_9CYAN|nr:S-layer family protein [Phormidium ambiguum]OKH30669.1 hypothetical protein NIES2119_30570 [Phormidium ambiguum IAM M-71]
MINAICFWVPSSIAFGCLVTVSSARAQIVPDASLPVPSVVTPQGNTNFSIEGGTRAGGNLFHSFREFSVPTGGEAFFNNAVDVRNIFSRVTGGSTSNIDGLIRANGTANLFLINPNGIIFGPNARLSIGGSFLASTSRSIVFADGMVFSARPDASTPPLLTVSVPIGLQYGANPGSILNQSVATDSNGDVVGLQVEPGKSLALVGGNVSVEGGQLLAPGGRVELGGVAGEGTVGLSVNGSDWRLSFPVGVPLSDVSITDNAIVNVRAGGGGNIAINSRLLNISGEDTRLRAGIAEGSGSVDAQAGDIDINATEAMNLDASVISNLVVSEESVGNGGNVNITTGSLSVTNGGQIQAITYGQGNAGNVNITARDRVSLHGFDTKVSSEVDKTGVGNAGDINLNARELVVTNGGFLSASALGSGNAGNVIITVHDRVSFDGVGRGEETSGASSRVGQIGIGNGGNIKITTRELFITGGAQLSASTLGQGNAGDINITAHERVFLNGVGSNRFSSGVFSTVQLGAKGEGNNINITTNSLSIAEGAYVSTKTQGEGNGGDITVNANTIDLASGGQILTTSSNIGRAGNLTLNVTQRISLSGSDRTYKEREQFENRVSGVGDASGLYANTLEDSTNRGGDLTVKTRQLIVRDGAQVTVNSEGTGNAGNLSVTANSILLDKQGQLIADTASGEGDIILQVESLLLMRRNSRISATAENNGNGGNITINAALIVAFPGEDSDIFANADLGNGGNIKITTQGIFGLTYRREQTNESDITAKSNSGLPGTVTISRLTVDPNQGLVALPTGLIDASQLIANSCIGRSNRQEGSFVITGRGGLPPRPGDSIDSPYTTGNIRSLPDTSVSYNAPVRPVSVTNPSHSEQFRETVPTDSLLPKKAQNLSTPANESVDGSSTSPQNQIVEARGWIIDAKGVVTLVAQAPTITSYSPALPSVPCYTP